MLDTDILIELRRGKPEALQWLIALTDEPPVCHFAALELRIGCQSLAEWREVERFLKKFTILYPSSVGLKRAEEIAVYKLSHGLSAMDALIAATALEYGLTLYTFNLRHFRAVPGLKVVVPYPR